MNFVQQSSVYAFGNSILMRIVFYRWFPQHAFFLHEFVNLITAIFVIGTNSFDLDIELSLDQITEEFERSIELGSLFQLFNEDDTCLIISEGNKITRAVIGFNERFTDISVDEVKRLI